MGVIFAFFAMTGGDFSAIMNAPNFGPSFVDGAGAMPFQLVITFAIVFFIGVMGQPTMLAKMYAVKSHKDLKLAGMLGGTAYGALPWCGSSSATAPYILSQPEPCPGHQGPGQGGIPLCE